MGLFLSTAQILSTSSEGADIRIDDVANALCDLICSQGFVLANDGDEVNREVRVVPPGGGRWISVHDESLLLLPDGLNELCLHLSRTVKASTLGIAVHDSDVLTIGLFEQGEVRANLCNTSDDFEDGAPNAQTEDDSDLSPWIKFLIQGQSEQAFRELLESDPVCYRFF